jgi:colanic acid biosynthesis glycosyl transferase WcaI
MHVLLLNQAFAPDVVATAQMSKDLADELIARGHSVSAIASRSIYGGRGSVLPGRENVDGTDVHRLGVSIFGKTGYAARIADFSFFYVLATLRALTLGKPDVVVSFTTPPFIAGAGLLCRLLRGSKAVYWVMDLYPDLPVACGVMKKGGLITGFFEWINRFLLRGSDVVVVLGRCMQKRVVAKQVDPGKVKFIPVWADLSGITAGPRDDSPYRQTWQLGNNFTVMYSGNFGIGHDARTICEAMKLLAGEPDLKFVFVGGGKRRLEVERFVADEGLTNAAWHEYVPREALGQSLAAADVHLISLKDGVEGIMVPSKLFGIMAAGRPGIFIGHPDSEISRVLSEHQAGFTVAEGNARELADAILRLKSDHALRKTMGENARRAVPGRYDKATACHQWAELLEALTGVPQEAAR